MTEPIRSLIPSDSPEAMIVAHQEPSADACRRAGVVWRGEGIGLGAYSLEDCERLTTLPASQHGDMAVRMGAWQLVRAAYAESGRVAPPLPSSPSRSRVGASEPVKAAGVRGPILTIGGKPVGMHKPKFEGEIVKADSTHISDVVADTPINPIGWAKAGLDGPIPATLADCTPHQLAALAGLHADTPAGRAFVTRAQWCLRALVPEVA